MSKDQKQLAELFNHAQSVVEAGDVYVHYKDSALTYRIIAVALEEASLEPCVVYQAQYGEHITFTRPLSSWLDVVDWQGVKTTRFKKLS